MATTAVLWCAFWIILDVTLAVPKFVAVASLCFAMVVFAIGETMLSPVGPALVNDIAPSTCADVTTPPRDSPGASRIGGARDHRALFRSRTGELVAVQYGRDRAVRRPVDVEPSSTPERPRRRSRARDQPDLVPRE